VGDQLNAYPVLTWTASATLINDQITIGSVCVRPNLQGQAELCHQIATMNEADLHEGFSQRLTNEIFVGEISSAIRTAEPMFRYQSVISLPGLPEFSSSETVTIHQIEPGRWSLIASLDRLGESLTKQHPEKWLDCQFRYLFDYNPLPMFVVEIDSMRFIDANRAAVESYGYSRDEFLNMSIFDIRSSPETKKLREELPEFNVEPVYQGYWKHRKKNGEEIDVEILTRDVLLQDSNKQLRIVSANDVTKRLTIERTLMRTQERLARAQKLAGIGSWTFDIASGTFWLSDEYYRIAGYEPGGFEPTRENIIGCIHPVDRDSIHVKAAIESSRDEPVIQELRIQRPSKEIRYVVSRYQVERDTEGNPKFFEGTIQDITETRVFEQEIIRRTAFLEAEMKSSRMGLCLMDENANIVFANQLMLDLWQADLVEVQQWTFADRIRRLSMRMKDPEAFIAESKRLHMDTTIDRITEIEMLDGRIFERTSSPVVGSNGQNLGLVLMITDVTEMKRALRTAQDSEASIRHMMESIPHLVWVGNPDGSNEYVNQNWIKYTGLTQEQSSGFKWFEVIHPDDLEEKKAHWIEAGGRGSSLDLECRIRDKDGNYRWYRIAGVPFSDADGKNVKWFGTCTDVHERHLVESDLEQRVEERTAQLELTNHELADAKREADSANAAKSEFLSRMSHELRTPLNSILGFGQILEMSEGREYKGDAVQYILKGGRHLVGLIDEILDISRVESGHIELELRPVRLADIVADTFKLMQPFADERGITMITQCAPGHPEFAMADPQRLRQILLNLASNGIKYNRPQGSLTFSCCRVGTDRLQIQVRDTGNGLSEEQMGRLFRPFDRLGAERSSIEGTGLGLVLCQKLAEAMQGSLSVTSTQGFGSVFSVELGLGEEPTIPSITTQDPATLTAKPSLRKHKILCIEDNPSNLQLIEAIFSQRPNIELLESIQGRIGIDLARQHCPSVILLDIHLPDISGHEVLKSLKENPETSSIPVIAVSADATDAQIDRIMALGATRYLTKPIDVSKFIGTVDEILCANELIQPTE